eukprot:153974-Alexandrium_andersonii.AAC.1
MAAPPDRASQLLLSASQGEGGRRFPHSGSQFSGSRELRPAGFSCRRSARFGPLPRSRFS